MAEVDARRAGLRKATLQLVLGVVALDTIVLSVWYGTGMQHAASDARTRFAIVWMILTAVLVAVLLRRVRRYRSVRTG